MTKFYVASTDDGVVICDLNLETGELKVINTVAVPQEGKFVNFHPTKRILYASSMDGRESFLHALSMDDDDQLTLLNSQPAGGNSPCYVKVDGDGKHVMLVNYAGFEGRGSVVVFPLHDDGQLEPRSEFIQHDGSSVNTNRQGESHPHMITTTPDNRYVLVSDLGIDKVMVYQIEGDNLTPHSPDSFALEAGAGPRHIAFHPSKNYVYVINELNSTLSAFNFDAKTGIAYDIATVSTLKAPHQGNYPSDLHFHPAGQFLYGSNRGHNSIAIFKVDEETGKPELIGTESTQGDWPRAFIIDPSGQYLIAANERSGTIFSYRIDSQSGKLSPTGYSIDVPSPVCMNVKA